MWAIKNTGYKIRTANDVMIETYGPIRSEYTNAITVTKEPLGGGRYAIRAIISCGNDDNRCRENPKISLMKFNVAVSAATK